MNKCFGVLLLSAVLVGVPLQARAQFGEIGQSEPAIAQSSNEAIAKAEEFVNLLAAGDFAAALTRYDTIARESVSQQTLQDKWQDLIARFGEFKEYNDSQLLSDTDTNIVVLTSEFERETVDLLIIFDEDGEIYSFDYGET
ncbi:DUF3887 domain-containing protein [Phormidium sp. CCY1219]|jgi:hypothetical protein|uniref:DUF3887 domain-containing protein n=1 Tax=Phormidium sp. CCY1219 TaxID=2886104 RepID=UPI002D1F4E00|nr:DUF3887 domain-containing protein [Phormidium sp. CCY1219]MEB3827014.1 DUF3887 domain-containing protein [Phormidium sp. CCY1219]